MTLAPNEFIRRFLLHVLPHGFHRIRHYSLLAGPARKASLALARELLNVAAQPDDGTPDEPYDFRRHVPAAADASQPNRERPMTRPGIIEHSAAGHHSLRQRVHARQR